MPQFGCNCTKLKPGAIPTIFKHKIYDKINIDGAIIPNKQSTSRKRNLDLQHKQVISQYIDRENFLKHTPKRQVQNA